MERYAGLTRRQIQAGIHRESEMPSKETLEKAEHPVSLCMKHVPKDVDNPGAYCNEIVHEKMKIPRKKK